MVVSPSNSPACRWVCSRCQATSNALAGSCMRVHCSWTPSTLLSDSCCLDALLPVSCPHLRCHSASQHSQYILDSLNGEYSLELSRELLPSASTSVSPSFFSAAIEQLLLPELELNSVTEPRWGSLTWLPGYCTGIYVLLTLF